MLIIKGRSQQILCSVSFHNYFCFEDVGILTVSLNLVSVMYGSLKSWLSFKAVSLTFSLSILAFFKLNLVNCIPDRLAENVAGTNMLNLHCPPQVGEHYQQAFTETCSLYVDTKPLS